MDLTHQLHIAPMFPSTVSVGTASITLHADGGYEGDVPAFLEAVRNAKMDGTPFSMPILWLIANAIKPKE
jgi:hypothetical protein